MRRKLLEDGPRSLLLGRRRRILPIELLEIEAGDRLRFAILGDDEIIQPQSPHHRSGPVAHDDVDGHELGACTKRRAWLAGSLSASLAADRSARAHEAVAHERRHGVSQRHGLDRHHQKRNRVKTCTRRIGLTASTSPKVREFTRVSIDAYWTVLNTLFASS